MSALPGFPPMLLILKGKDTGASDYLTILKASWKLKDSEDSQECQMLRHMPASPGHWGLSWEDCEFKVSWVTLSLNPPYRSSKPKKILERGTANTSLRRHGESFEWEMRTDTQKPRATSRGMTPPTVDQALHHPSLIKKMPYRLLFSSVFWRHFLFFSCLLSL
eukprot:XP_017449884.1 PREDICTED: uncharacterized protein LOC108351157 isoform X1 [Rattus norvegicus]